MKLFGNLFARNVLYYPGCLTKLKFSEIEENYRRILDDIDIDFLTLKDTEVCCGWPALEAGYLEDFKELREKNIQLFKDHGIGTIVVNCPFCLEIFSKRYRNEFKVKHITELINLDKIPQTVSGKITYLSPPEMRDITEPVKILKKMGYKVKVIKECSGVGGLFKANNPAIANKIAKRILSKVKTPVLVTPCPWTCAHLKQNADGKIDILEFSEAYK